MPKEEKPGTKGARPRTYYFGCIYQAGHYMHTPDLRSERAFLYSNPWGLHVDNGLIPKNGAPFALHQKDGWTAFAFVDNTVDSRLGSNSVFLAEGAHTANEMIRIAKEDFPAIAKRVRIDLFEERP